MENGLAAGLRSWRVGAGWAGIAAIIAFGVVLGALPFYLAVAVVGAAAIVLLTLARPELGLGILAASVPFGVIREFSVAGLPLTATEILVGLMLLAWTGIIAARKRLHIGPLLWPIALYLGILVLSLTVTTNKSVAIKEVLRWGELLVAYIITVSVISSERERRQLVALVLLSGLAVSLMGWAQFFLKIGPPAFRIGPFLRAYGTFGQPNPFAGYLGMVLPLAVALVVLWTRETKLNLLPRPRMEPGRFQMLPEFTEVHLRYIALASVAVMSGALLMTMSRGAWIGAFIAFSVVMIARGRRTALILAGVVFLGILILVAGVFNLLPEALSQRVFTAISYFGIFDVRYVTITAENWPVVERMAQWQVAWEMFQDHWYLGVGAGGYPVRYADYALKEWPKAMGHAHNIYLNVAAETGIIGLLGYAAMVISWIWVAARRAFYLRRVAFGSVSWAVVVGCLGVLLATSLHNTFDNLYVHGMNVHIGLILGLIALRGNDG